MLVIALVRSEKLPALREAFFRVDWQVWEVCQFDMAGEDVVRVIIRCDKVPPPEFEIPIEAVFKEPKYCQVCAKKLQPHNASGYCYRHQDKDPRRSIRKRK